MAKLLLATIVLSLFVGPGTHAEETMNPVALTTTIGEGSEQEVTKVYENAWTKLVQITLRHGKTLANHTAPEAITIHCVSGEGVLVLGEKRIALTPGVIVPLEPNVPHAVESKPAVSVLVTRFVTKAAPEAEHHH